MAEKSENYSQYDMQTEILNAISCGVFAYTIPDHRLLTMNDEARRIIGCGKDEDEIDSIVNFLKNKIYPEDIETVRSVNGRLRKVGDYVKYAYKVIDGDSLLYLRSTIKLLQFADGQKYILCSMLDVTEQAVSTLNLRMERKSYRDALSNDSEFTFLFDVTEGIINEEFVTAHNVNIVRELGLSVPIKFDKLLAAYVKECGIEFVNEEMRRHFTRDGLLDAYRSGVRNAVTEFYNSRDDIHIRTSCLMSRDEETGHIHASVVGVDITDVRKKEHIRQEALRMANDEMNKRMDAILNGISGGLKIADVNDDYRYEYISEGAALLQGYTVDEFLEKFGRRVTSNIYEGDGEIALAEAERQMNIQGHYSVKYRVPCKDGSIKWVVDRGKLIEDSRTGEKHWYILMQDVTELEERNIQIKNMLNMQEEMTDSISCGFFAYTLPEREILIINQEAERIFSSTGQLNNGLSCSIMSCIIEEDIDSVREAIQKLKNVGDRTSYVFHSQRVDGKGLITVKSDTKMLSFANGQKYILSALTDITEQEQIEKKLEEERRQYRNAVAIGSEVIFTIDLETAVIKNDVISVDGNNLTRDLGLVTPVSYDELAAAWFNEKRIVTASRDIDLVRSRDNLMKALEDGKSVIDVEYYIPETCKYRRVLILLYRINGQIFASFTIYDVTASRSEKKERQNIIESLGRIYSALYHISLRDYSCTVIKANADISENLGEKCTYRHFHDTYLEEFVHPDHVENMREFLDIENICRNLLDNDYISIEFLRKNFGWCRVFLVVSERDRDGKVVSFVFAGNVIDAQKTAELKQQEALKMAYESANMANSAKTDFLANMSHDIRTPMNAIIGLTAIAGTHIDDRECIADCLSKITVSSKHLLGIINEVLDMSKIESGKMELQEDEFNLSELIDNLLMMSKPEVSSKKHKLSVVVKNIEHEYVIGDSQRIQQVFMNIMNNAIKYTPVGGNISLTISEKATNKQKVGCYEFIFEDNGIGMSEDFQKHIFEPFSRAVGDKRINSIQGTGLGMPITRNIVQMMNGDIKVKSKINEGTTITVTLFLKLRSGENDLLLENLIDLPVLVADDDETSCVYTCQLLKEIGMVGEWVLSGREAIEKIGRRNEEKNGFFAVILDWKMPDMDGIETARQIRKNVGKDVPIIIISAYDWSDIEQEARQAGVNAFISKPLFKSRVMRLFSSLVNGDGSENKFSDLDALSNEDFSGRRALLVEDNSLNAEIAGEILTMVGFDIDYATDGRQAVDIMAAVEDNYYDVVFMDIQMPIMNGYEAARAIRELSGDYKKSVPIIAMTANAFAEDVAMAKNAGMNEHIAKPLDFGQLLKALNKWLR